MLVAELVEVSFGGGSGSVGCGYCGLYGRWCGAVPIVGRTFVILLAIDGCAETGREGVAEGVA